MAVPFATVRAEMQMSDMLAAEVTQFPGSTVTFSNELPGGGQAANLNCGKTPPEEVASYYKAKLTEKGYTINLITDGLNIVALKGERQVLVDFENENGETVVTLVLNTGETDMTMSSGQTPTAPGMPTMPAMPGAMPQMPNIADGSRDAGPHGHARSRPG
jgi:hypothetical protein